MKLNLPRIKKEMSAGWDFPRNARLHWRWFLIVLLVLFITVLVLALGFVGRLSEIQSAPAPSSSGAGEETINREKLDQVLKIFEERAAKAAELLKKPPAAVDPSR